MYGFMMSSTVSAIDIHASGVPVFVAVNQHAELVRMVYIFSLVEVTDYRLSFDQNSSLDVINHLLFRAHAKMAVGAFFGLFLGVLVSFWTKKIVRDNHNMIQLILGSYLILFATFKLFMGFGSRFTALVSFTLTVKTIGFSKFKFNSTSI